MPLMIVRCERWNDEAPAVDRQSHSGDELLGDIHKIVVVLSNK